MKRWGYFACALLLGFLSASARAAILSADFNGLGTSGDLQGKGGGTGFTGNWAGSNTLDVQAGDLTSSLYNKPQSGTATRITGASTGAVRQVFRTATTDLTGEIWFSFLASPQTASNSRVGISINSPTATPFTDRGNVFFELQAGAATLDASYRFGNATDQTAATSIAVSTTPVLVVGQLQLTGGGGPDSVKVWLNPDIATNADMSLYTPVVNASGTNFADSLNHFGLILYAATSGTNLIDNVYFSDGGGSPAQAFLDVTGVNAVPEPGTWLALGVAASGMFFLRRRTGS